MIRLYFFDAFEILIPYYIPRVIGAEKSFPNQVSPFKVEEVCTMRKIPIPKKYVTSKIEVTTSKLPNTHHRSYKVREN